MRLERWTVAAVFAVSRVLYFLAGVRFDASSLDYYWQFVDPRLLATDLWRSLFHLHAQPPLFNLFLGTVLHLPAGWRMAVFHAVFLILGLALALCLHTLQARLGVPRGVRLAATLLFTLSPACVLYENHLFYAYPVAAALTAAALCLHRYLASGQRRDGFLFGTLASAVVLTQSLFHLLWLAPVLCLAKRRWLAVFLLLPGLWYLRGALLFGGFTASSWLGMNLAQVILRPLSPLERQEVAALPGCDRLRTPPFSPLPSYSGISTAKTGVPLLDEPWKSTGAPNFHHLAFVEIAHRYQAADLAAIRQRPSAYLRGTGAAWVLFFRSAADSPWLGRNAEKIRGWSRIWNRAVYGQLRPFRGALSGWSVGWLLVAGTLAGLVFGIRRALGGDRTVLFLLLAVLYVAVVGNGLELGENERFRFLVEPLQWTLLALGIESAPRLLMLTQADRTVRNQSVQSPS